MTLSIKYHLGVSIVMTNNPRRRRRIGIVDFELVFAPDV